MSDHGEGMIGERMKLFREQLKLNQAQMAEALGGTTPGYKKNEQGVSIPNSKVVVGMGRLGANLNWLLLGDGPVLRSELESARINKEALAKVVEVMMMTAEPGETPKQIGQKVVDYYTYLLESGKITVDGVGTGNVHQAA